MVQLEFKDINNKMIYLKIKGKLVDEQSIDILNHDLESFATQELIIDLRELDNLSNDGLKCLLVNNKKLHLKGIAIKIINTMNFKVRETFRITGFNNIFKYIEAKTIDKLINPQEDDEED